MACGYGVALLSHAGDIWLWGFFRETFGLSLIVRMHEMVSAALLANATYLVARLRLSRSTAGVVVVLFALSWPLMDAAVSLPSRHYVEGAFFAALSLFFHAKVRDGAEAPLRGGLLLSAFFYLLSVTAKEVFVPLPVFLFLVGRAVGSDAAALLVRCLAKSTISSSASERTSPSPAALCALNNF